MSNKTEQKLTAKKEQYNIRITTFVKGTTKNDFIDDCLKRGIGESQNAKQIIQLHYKIISVMPSFKGKEFSEIYKLILKGMV